MCKIWQPIFLYFEILIVSEAQMSHCYCPSKLSWKRSKGFELNKIVPLYSVPVDQLHYNLNVHGLRMVSEMFLVFNCQPKWFDNKSSCYPPLKDNVTNWVYSYFKLNSFRLICYDNSNVLVCLTKLFIYWFNLLKKNI